MKTGAVTNWTGRCSSFCRGTDSHHWEPAERIYERQIIEYRISFIKGLWLKWLTWITHV